MRCVSFILLLCSFGSHADDDWAIYLAQSYRFGDEVNAELPFEVSDEGGRANAVQLWAPHGRTTNWQIYLSQFQREIEATATDDFQIRHWQFGGTKATETSALTPFVGATIGAAQIETVVETQTRWAFTLSTGMRWQMAPHLSLIFDARWLGILFNSATAIACDGNQCRLQFDSGVWSQYEVGIAVGVQF